MKAHLSAELRWAPYRFEPAMSIITMGAPLGSFIIPHDGAEVLSTLGRKWTSFPYLFNLIETSLIQDM